MARGFESKAVESQKQDAEDRAAQRMRTPKSPEEMQRDHQRESIGMSRVRVLHDLESARTEVHRRSLIAALEHLDSRLAALDKTKPGND